MRKVFLRLMSILSMLLFFNAMPNELAAKSLKNIIAFGDSLTDVGNVAGLTEPGFKPKINGYYEETHFSDNVIWLELVASTLGLPTPTPGRGSSTSLTPKPKGTDWAWGGAEAAEGSDQPPGVTEPIPNLLPQVDQYLASNAPSRRTLYSIWAGADNLLIGGNFSPEAAESAVLSIVTAMQQLEAAGARNFLIFNLPELADTPSAISEGAIAQLAAATYTESFNIALVTALKKLKKDRSFKAKIYFVNVYDELSLVVNSVNKKGCYAPKFYIPGCPVVLTNVTSEAIGIFNATSTFPPNYLFWDDVHPTTQAHQIVAGLVLKAIRNQHHRY